MLLLPQLSVGFKSSFKSTSQPDIQNWFGNHQPNANSHRLHHCWWWVLGHYRNLQCQFQQQHPLISSGHNAGDALKPATGTLVGNELNRSLKPNWSWHVSQCHHYNNISASQWRATRGSATFGTQTAGTDKWFARISIQAKGNGAYEVMCEETVTVSYDIYYWDSDWVVVRGNQCILVSWLYWNGWCV